MIKHRMISAAFLATFTVILSLRAEEVIMTVDSTVAEYNGKMITLGGHVVVEHELGRITAETIEITSDAEETAGRSHLLTMTENVKIDLCDGGQLCCSSADIDYSTLEGHFHGGEGQEHVIYTENATQKNALNQLILKSRHMTVHLGKNTLKSSTPSRRCINSITANKHVTINYRTDFTAAADTATYQRYPEEQVDNTSQQMAGLISLRASDQNGQCQVMTRRGDLIRASHICIDTVKRQLLFAYAKGALGSTLNPNQRVDFASDTLTWDEKQNVLTLRDHVVVNQQGIGILTNDKEIQLIHQIADNGSKQLGTIESTGTTVLTFVDEERQLSHTLTCYGKACVNNRLCQTIMDSPRDLGGNVLEGKQVSFKDNMGEIFADKLTVDYTLADSTPIPTRILLEGHVRIFGKSKVTTDDSGAFLQYAIADIAEYSPQAKELTLTAAEKNRVLFYDRVNSLQISATKLKVRRDQATSKESVQGFGDVRFSFVQHELEQMRKHFQLD